MQTTSPVSSDVIRLIQHRHSSRMPFDPKRPIAQQDLHELLEAARWAPTPHNMQNFDLVVIDDPALLERIGKIESRISLQFIRENYQQLSFSEAELRRKKVGILAASFPPTWTNPASFERAADDGTRRLGDILAGSPMVLLVLYDPRKRAPASAGDFLGIIGLGSVMENLWLAAESLGIGMQIISSFSGVERELRAILKFPDSMKVAYGLRLGYPVTVRQPLRVRRDLADFVHRNGWDHPAED